MKLLFFIKIFLFANLFFNYCYGINGVSQKKIVLVTNQPLTGPAQEFSNIGKSSRAYFQYVNDQGGVHGRSVELIIIDDQFNPEKTIQKISELTIKKECLNI